MEELRSVEILNKEVQNEALKKAEKIIKDSQDAQAKILSSVDLRLEKAKSEKTLLYDAKVLKAENDAKATLPLEKQRFLISFVRSSILDALKEYFASLSVVQKNLLLENLLKKFQPIIASQKINLFVINFDKKNAENIVNNVLGKNKILSSTEKISDEGDFAQGFFLETEDKSIKCRVTFAEIAENLQDFHNEELAQSLFGGRLKW